MVVRELLATPFKVNMKMHYPMFLSVMDNLVLLVMILLIPIMKDPILYFVIAYSISNLPGFLFSFFFLKKKFGYKYEFTLDRGMWLLKESLPLFGFVVLSTIFLQIDVVILDSYKGHYDVGIYSAGTRLTMPLSIIPNAIVTTVFPILVKRLNENENTEFISNMVIKLLFVISFVMAAVFTFESKEIIVLIFGREYSLASLSASILYWSQIFLFFSYYSLSVLIADNKQHYNFIFSGVQVVINIVLGLILIPTYSYFGAALAKLFASFGSFLFILFALNKFGFKPSIGRYKILFWSGLLVGIFWLISSLHVIPYLIVSAIIILIVTFFTGIFSREELLVFFKLIRQENLGIKILSRFQFIYKH